MAARLPIAVVALGLMATFSCGSARADIVTLTIEEGGSSDPALIYSMGGPLCVQPQNTCTMTGTIIVNTTLGTVISEDFTGEIDGVTKTCIGSLGLVGTDPGLDNGFNTEIATTCGYFGIYTPISGSLDGYLGGPIDGGSSQNSFAYFGNDVFLVGAGAEFYPTAIPEPTSLVLLLIGLGVLGVVVSRRQIRSGAAKFWTEQG